jgi:hypothetical protein
MSNLRGVEGFPALWERRTTVTDADGTAYELLSLADLVQAKKTQRGKDWPMLHRLLEAHYLKNRAAPTPEQRQFWLRELRTPELLVEAAQAWPQLAQRLSAERPLLLLAEPGKLIRLEEALVADERAERERDRLYWQPLKAELEKLRHEAMKQP